MLTLQRNMRKKCLLNYTLFLYGSVGNKHSSIHLSSIHDGLQIVLWDLEGRRDALCGGG